MKKLFFISLFSSLLSISCVNQNANAQQLNTNLSEHSIGENQNPNEQEIELGKSFKFKKENIKITFNQIVKDSRCPKEARCITAGVFQAKITIKEGVSKSKTIVISDREEPIKNYTNKYIHGNYIIEISGVYPQKSIRKTNEPKRIGVTIHEVSK